LKNSFLGISAAKLVHKLSNVRPPSTLKFTEITALVPFSTPTPVNDSHSGKTLSASERKAMDQNRHSDGLRLVGFGRANDALLAHLCDHPVEKINDRKNPTITAAAKSDPTNTKNGYQPCGFSGGTTLGRSCAQPTTSTLYLVLRTRMTALRTRSSSSASVTRGLGKRSAERRASGPGVELLGRAMGSAAFQLSG
jgi:hypothetical protein